ncbi:MAG: methyltransferase domain-containing protein [Nitrososphaerota archaeon]
MIDDGQELILVGISAGIAGKAAERAVERQAHNRIHIIVGDFRYLPLRPECVDMSCSFGSIEHVPEYMRAFYEQVRVVRVAERSSWVSQIWLEAGNIAWECPGHEGYHINIDSVVLELEETKLLESPLL